MGNDLKAEIDSTNSFLEFLGTCSSVEEACQRIVHDRRFSLYFKAAYVFSHVSERNPELVVGYGPKLQFPWADQSSRESGQIAELATEPRYLTSQGLHFLHVPLLLGSVPIAHAILQVNPEAGQVPIRMEALQIAQRAGGFFLKSVPLVRPSLASSQAGLPIGFTLSQRHHDILSLMSEGLSNRQIGYRLSVSESTIRQENIKIFKFLGVKTRSEAVAKAPLSPPPFL